MRFVLLALATLAVGALALPPAPSTCACLDDKSAKRVANNFKTLITNYSNASAAAYLTPDVRDYSDSVNELINNGCSNGPAPLGTATFDSLVDFQAGQGSQPNIPFEILNIWYGCSAVTLRWRSTYPGGPANPQQFVTGIIVLETVCATGTEKYKIKTVYSEFNSGAWLYDLGVFVPECS
ncbi:uncharacterized protein RCC_07449 [Ramularia collo-cygni]|uniref:NTF2-like domain-containing protein n=1 Tax=Ramularia collo-cygni TaxID=112498 RepID=A0A2D3V4H6_9PEZI|nr:uncharacterized protein RCC_07449 [Ramularia collo-cygni]CZT21585.1 uncharacterized protein RCC_07449 [Ramularia collo-cygni]